MRLNPNGGIECILFRIGIRNMSSEMFRDRTFRDILPTELSYINGSTRIYNAKHPLGVTLSDNIITDNDINIGDYLPGTNAWIYFNATAPEMTSTENIIIQACGGYGSNKKPGMSQWMPARPKNPSFTQHLSGSKK